MSAQLDIGAPDESQRPYSRKRICSVPGCGKKHCARGWCGAHWAHWKKTGDVATPYKIARRGEGTLGTSGYRVSGRQYSHIEIAERALGKPLPSGAQVHHWNEIKTDNRPENLVICPDQAYHSLLHRRARAVAAGADPSWIRCGYCKKYDDPKNMEHRNGRGTVSHRSCKNEYAKRRLAARRVIKDLDIAMDPVVTP
jgi:HNH endonuclease